MVTIVKRKGKTDHYYVYDYEKNPETGMFRRKYVGTATKEDYEAYLKNLDDKLKYCKICGKRKKRFAEYLSQDVCGCKNGTGLPTM
jgi:hypothetical protein